MYKIKNITSGYLSILIQDGTDPKTGLTYLEIEVRNTKKSTIGVSSFFQETIPNCETKYWKVENKIVVEMSESEKEYVDKLAIYEAKKEEFKGKRYCVHVPTISAQDTGFIYVKENYPDLFSFVSVQNSIISVIDENTFDSFAYLDEITGYFKSIIDADSRFIVLDVESWNPNK